MSLPSFALEGGQRYWDTLYNAEFDIVRMYLMPGKSCCIKVSLYMHILLRASKKKLIWIGRLRKNSQTTFLNCVYYLQICLHSQIFVDYEVEI